ncbi:sialate O-acetylesterase [Ruficoccus amylovorans]|uniref:Sialate O-acetylesterase n=1 Tax=Ruficoccus amylovorans TaxID=1804625 RepID=A0A842H9E7_9BACT|nr:sialate O-acetylesterase [Ruficoccus amylovorans]MBC2592885.1 sialate O-acetylesterase [Ruficoccus amylovorans]
MLRIKKIVLYLFEISLLPICISVSQADSDRTPLPPKENFHLYLLAGQSNMSGRGVVEEQDKIPHPRVLMLNQEGQWVAATEPVHYDKSGTGVGPGRTFAMSIAADDETITIGLIPSACGGSSITHWAPGAYFDQTQSHPFDDALSRTRLAMKDGTLKGILWHQGEADSTPELSPLYKHRLEVLIERFRTEFNDPQLPFIIGQLGHFPQRRWTEERQHIDRAHREIAKEVQLVGFVSSEGLTSKPDNLHFDAASQREFGQRYAEVYRELVQENDPDFPAAP